MTQALLHTTTLYRDRLVTLEGHATQRIHAAHLHMLSTLEPHLHALYSHIDATYTDMRQQADEDEPAPKIPLQWLYERRRMSTITAQVEHAVTQFTASAQTVIVELTHQSQALGSESAQAQIHAVLQTAKPAEPATYHGVTLTSGIASEAVAGVRQSLIRGLSLGRDGKQIGKSINEALTLPLKRAVGVAVNVAITAYRWAVSRVYRANKDEIVGWVWTSTAGACPWCADQNGSEHGLDEEMESHNFCHCTQQPLLASEQTEEIE